MAIDETGLNKGQVRKLTALRKSVGDDLAEEVFAKWLEREVTSHAKGKPDPVAMKIVEALAGFVHDPKFKRASKGLETKNKAAELYRKALGLNPDLPEAHNSSPTTITAMVDMKRHWPIMTGSSSGCRLGCNYSFRQSNACSKASLAR